MNIGTPVLRLNPSPTNARNSEATFVRLANGRVMMAWSKFIGDDHSDFGKGVIASRYSDDDGKTWSTEDRLLVDHDGATNVMSPSFVRLRSGRVALFYLKKLGHRMCVGHVRFSDDECQTFSEARRFMPEDGYFVVNNDRVIQMSSGRIVVPVAMHRFRLPAKVVEMERLPGDTKTHYPTGHETYFSQPGVVFYMYSDDGGESWLESLTSLYHCDKGGAWGLQEPGVVELGQGKLWSFMRTGLMGIEGVGSRQWESFSDDGGMTWTAAAPSQFVSPCSPMQVKRHPKSDLLVAVWNDQSGRHQVAPAEAISWGRTPLALAISRDCGKNWNRSLLLEDAPDHGFCYPAIYFGFDALLVSYNAGGASSRNPLDTQQVKRLPYGMF
jgi:sialidase-1